MTNEKKSSKELFYRRTSDHFPVCIFVHGFGCSHEDWSHVLDRIGKEIPSLAVDLPGHGRSYPCVAGTIEEMAQAVLQTIRSVSPQPVILIGHSLGTKIIRECYRQSPETISSLIFVDGSTYEGSAEKLVGSLRNNISSAGFEPFIRDLFEKMFISGVSPGLSSYFMQRTLRLNPIAAQNMLEDSIYWDTKQGDIVLQTITVPTLLIQSTYFRPGIGRSLMTCDIETPFMKKIRDLVQGAEIQVLEGVGHFPMIDALDDFVHRITNFIIRNRLLDPVRQR